MARIKSIKLTHFRNNLSEYSDKLESGEIKKLHITRFGEVIFTINSHHKQEQKKRKLGVLK